MDFGRAIRVIHCKTSQCDLQTPESTVPVPAGQGDGPVTASPGRPSALGGTTISYQLLEQDQYGFLLEITIRAQHSPGPWKLSFVIPGARNVYVIGAPHSQSGSDRVTVSNYYGGTESAGYAPISGPQTGGNAGSGRNGYIAQFQVRGTGTPGAPADCSYNSMACQFKPLPSQAGEQWPGSG